MLGQGVGALKRRGGWNPLTNYAFGIVFLSYRYIKVQIYSSSKI